MASFMVSSSSELVIDYVCDCGWWGRQAGAVCMFCVCKQGEGRKVFAIRLAHWVNEFSHADRNDAKSFPIAET